MSKAALRIAFTFLLLILISMSSCQLKPQKKPLPQQKFTYQKSDEEEKHIKNIIKDVNYLTSEELSGREPGTEGEQKAAKYLADRLTEIGLQSISGNYYILKFNIPIFEKEYEKDRLVYSRNKNSNIRKKALNVVGIFNGQDDQAILISAHYDHMGKYKNKLYAGANDNASGVAATLDVLERISKLSPEKRPTIIAAFWSGEEMGFLGSEAFAEGHIYPLNKIKAVYNLDTIGNGNENEFEYWATENNLAVNSLKKAAKYTQLKFTKDTDLGHNSDQITFSKVGLPAVTILSPDWLKDNQTPKDVASKVNPAKIMKVSSLVYQAIQIIEEKSPKER